MKGCVEIASDLAEARDVGNRVMDAVAECGYSERSGFAIRLALEEGLINAIKHGNGNDPNKLVRVRFDVTPRRVRITICDQGGGFDPCCVPDPTTAENREKPSGRGIMLMRAYMDEVEYARRGTEVCLIKYNRP